MASLRNTLFALLATLCLAFGAANAFTLTQQNNTITNQNFGFSVNQTNSTNTTLSNVVNFTVVSITEVFSNLSAVQNRTFTDFSSVSESGNSSLIASLNATNLTAQANMTVTATSLAVEGSNGSVLVSWTMNFTNYVPANVNNSIIVAFNITGSSGITFKTSNNDESVTVRLNSTLTNGTFTFSNSTQNASFTFDDAASSFALVNATIPTNNTTNASQLAGDLTLGNESGSAMTFGPALLVSALAAITMIALNL